MRERYEDERKTFYVNVAEKRTRHGGVPLDWWNVDCH